MVLTDRFVYIHMPKTGGTFVTESLLRLHDAAGDPRAAGGFVRSLLNSIASRSGPYGRAVDVEPKHGTCHQIPRRHRHKQILSSVRNPYDWYVSQYEFTWWKRTFEYHPEPNPTPAGYAIERVLPQFEKSHPYFPEISFAEFLDLCHLASSVYNRENGPSLGLYTHGFVRYYCKQVEPVLSRTNLESIESNLFDVHFIRTDRLAEQLQEYLTSMGYRAEDLAFIPGQGKILPMGKGRRDDQNWEPYYSPNLKEDIRKSDSLLFEMFPEFDV